MIWLLHVDMDQFVAAVELLRRPELRGRPVIVGGSGDPTRARQVVSTASYEARAYGVHSGMALREAARKCPDAVFLPTDGPAYQAASARVMAVLRRFPGRLEVWGWDEAFLGVQTADPRALAAAIRQAILAETGLSCSVGIGDNKHTAKVAARFAKPGGIHLLITATWMAVMGPRPASELWGVGPKTAKKLTELGLHTIADVAGAEPATLVARFGPRLGQWLPLLAQGTGDTHVETQPRAAKSHSRETTFEHDLADPAQIAQRVAAMARELAAEVIGAGRAVTHVAVKIRFRSFHTPVRVMKLRGGATTDVAVVEQAAATVLARIELDRPVRLIGVRTDLADEHASAGELAVGEPPAPTYGQAVEILRYTAFSADPAGGNPAGIVLDATGLDDATMLRVAADVGYSETAFLIPRGDNRFDVRYFSPLAEVPFCGHATIASAAAYAQRHGPGPLTFDTAAGRVEVATVRDPSGAINASLTSVPPRTKPIAEADLAALLDALRWSPDDLDPTLPPRVAYAGAWHPIVAAADRARLADLAYDMPALGELMSRRDWTTIDLVWRESVDVFHARNPFPPGGVVEDPATGAAAAAFGGYLRDLRLVTPPATVTIHQGVDMGRPSVLTVGIEPGGERGITVTGAAARLD